MVFNHGHECNLERLDWRHSITDGGKTLETRVKHVRNSVPLLRACSVTIDVATPWPAHVMLLTCRIISG